MKKFYGFQHGVNLGGWLSQGTQDKEHLDSFITESDIERISKWGLDHVRLPIDYETVENEDGSEKLSGYSYIDNCIEWCRKYGLNMILDLHKTAGYVFDNPEYSSGFFSNPAMQERFIRLWIKLAERYSCNSDMLAFELLNEIVDNDISDKWNKLIKRCIRAIRDISPDVRIITGGTDYNAVTSLKNLDEPYDENIIYTFHCYEPLIFTHQAAYWVEGMTPDFSIAYPDTYELYAEKSSSVLGSRGEFMTDKRFGFSEIGTDFFEKFFREALETAEKRNVPLYCGEYGVINNAGADDTIRWYKDIRSIFEKYGIGRAAWNYKGKDYGITDVDENLRSEIIKLL